jgi:hypothetical protein
MGTIWRIEVTIILALVCISVVCAQSCNWTGIWDTDWGEMELFQSEGVVSGNYSYDTGQILGTVSGEKLIGTWSEDPSFAPPDDAGDFEFTMSEDCGSFSGNWRYGSSGEWEGTWSGIRGLGVMIPGSSILGSEIVEYDQFLGLVEDGQFKLLAPYRPLGETVRLTSMPMQAAQLPESMELNLTDYEGKAIMVIGYDGGGWIYSASVIDHAGPILTSVVKEVFGNPDLNLHLDGDGDNRSLKNLY